MARYRVLMNVAGLRHGETVDLSEWDPSTVERLVESGRIEPIASVELVPPEVPERDRDAPERQTPRAQRGKAAADGVASRRNRDQARAAGEELGRAATTTDRSDSDETE